MTTGQAVVNPTHWGSMERKTTLKRQLWVPGKEENLRGPRTAMSLRVPRSPSETRTSSMFCWREGLGGRRGLFIRSPGARVGQKEGLKLYREEAAKKADTCGRQPLRKGFEASATASTTVR